MARFTVSQREDDQFYVLRDEMEIVAGPFADRAYADRNARDRNGPSRSEPDHRFESGAFGVCRRCGGERH